MCTPFRNIESGEQVYNSMSQGLRVTIAVMKSHSPKATWEGKG